MKLFDLVENVTTQDAVGFGACDGYERTTTMYVLNNTRDWGMKIVFFQAKCSFADELPEPYIADTGVYVGGVDIAVGRDALADPCAAGGRNKPIAATWGACSAVAKHKSGVEQRLSFPNIPEAGRGNYYGSLGWRMGTNIAIGSNGDLVEVLNVEVIGKIESI